MKKQFALAVAASLFACGFSVPNARAEEAVLTLEMTALRCPVDSLGFIRQSECRREIYADTPITYALPLVGEGNRTEAPLHFQITWMADCPYAEIRARVTRDRESGASSLAIQIGPVANAYAGPLVFTETADLESLAGLEIFAGFYDRQPNTEACSPGMKVKSAMLGL